MPFRKPTPVSYKVILFGENDVNRGLTMQIMGKQYQHQDHFSLIIQKHGANIQVVFREALSNDCKLIPQNFYRQTDVAIVTIALDLVDEVVTSSTIQNAIIMLNEVNISTTNTCAKLLAVYLKSFQETQHYRKIKEIQSLLNCNNTIVFSHYGTGIRKIINFVKVQLPTKQYELFTPLRSELSTVNLNNDKQSLKNNTMCYERNSIA